MRIAHEELDYGSKLRQQKQEDMLSCLANESGSPNRVWAQYVELLDISNDEVVPLEIHQRVLRRCTPSFQTVRTAYVRSLPRPISETRPHNHEGRFLTIFNALKRSGFQPALEDYEFVLEQFAAVGHHIGSARALRELNSKGLFPRTKTYGLCLQAIAYKLSLNHTGSDLELERLKDECSRLCLFVMRLVQKRAAERRKKAKGKQKMGEREEGLGKNGLPSVCVDLTLRIMKDTGDTETFLSLLKIAYGIDLDYLDRHPLSTEGAPEEPEQLSTAALTTLVDFFGRTSQLSKMIATFEVLKAPLTVPPPAPSAGNEEGIEGRDLDDEDDYVMPMDVLSTPLPSALPNITTYNTVIRHCVAQRHRNFAKHYVLEALEEDRKSSEDLQSLFLQFDRSVLPSQAEDISLEGLKPGVRVNVDTFRPLMGWANRYKNYALMKWTLMRLREVYRCKTEELMFFERILGVPRDFSDLPSSFDAEVDTQGPEISADIERKDGWAAADGLSNPSDFFTPSSLSSPISSSLPSSSSPSSPTSTPSSTSPMQPPAHPFCPYRHLTLLRTTREALKALDDRIGASLARIADRKKERLGRRVWQGKRVYLHEKRHCVLISKDEWRTRVRFGGRQRQEVLGRRRKEGRGAS